MRVHIRVYKSKKGRELAVIRRRLAPGPPDYSHGNSGRDVVNAVGPYAYNTETSDKQGFPPVLLLLLLFFFLFPDDFYFCFTNRILRDPVEWNAWTKKTFLHTRARA